MADQCILTKVDAEIRGFIKHILKLATCTSNHFIYLPPAKGGLGFTNLSDSVPLHQLGLIHRLEQSPNHFTRICASSSSFQRRKMRIMRKLDILDTGRESLQRAKSSIIEKRATLFYSQVQGDGNQFLRGNKSNIWIRDPKYMTGREYVGALHLRSNQLRTREFDHRGRGVAGEKLCRRCNVEMETQNHITQHCPFSLSAIRARHDFILDKIIGIFKTHHLDVVKEPNLHPLNEPSILFRPDIIIKHQGKAFIIDLSIPYELRKPMAHFAQLKITKYTPLITAVAHKYHLAPSDVSCHGLIIGARGSWPSLNDTLFKKLGINITREQVHQLTSFTINKTTKVFRSFMASSIHR